MLIKIFGKVCLSMMKNISGELSKFQAIKVLEIQCVTLCHAIGNLLGGESMQDIVETTLISTFTIL